MDVRKQGQQGPEHRTFPVKLSNLEFAKLESCYLLNNGPSELSMEGVKEVPIELFCTNGDPSPQEPFLDLTITLWL